MVEDKKLSEHDIETESRIFKKYAEICQKKKHICAECREKNPEILRVNQGLPVSFFTVGVDMNELKNRVMFVGKTVTYNWGPKADPPDPIDKESGVIDARYASDRLVFRQEPFFKCITDICRLLWKEENLKLEEIWRRIAVTNFTKCSNSNEGWEAKTTDSMKDNCLEVGFLEAELKEAKPTHLIFFTGPSYDNQIKKLLDIKYEIIDEPNNRNRKWWTVKPEENKIKTPVLRINNPYFIQFFTSDEKRQFYQKISSWIKKS